MGQRDGNWGIWIKGMGRSAFFILDIFSIGLTLYQKSYQKGGTGWELTYKSQDLGLLLKIRISGETGSIFLQKIKS